MPYIDPTIRVLYRDTITHFEHILVSGMSEGELNYLITSLCHSYLKTKGLKYSNINAILGVLDAAAREFYFTVARPYEDNKRMCNGSVSDLDRVGYTPEQKEALENTR